MFSHISRVAAARSSADDVFANKRPTSTDVAGRHHSADLTDRFSRRR